ncbi:hypothetical protein [Modestobacter lapidis]|nr:hypothetical protein [Modestobacter lapidis]
MSRNTHKRRPQARRFSAVGLGAAAVLVGTASAAGAATGVVIPLEPGEVVLTAFPAENLGDMNPMADPNAVPTLTPVGVQYGGAITVDLPAQLDDSTVEAELAFDDDADPLTPDVTYSSAVASSDPFYLAISGAGTGSIEVTLPADPGFGVDEATLSLEPLTSALTSPAFTVVDPVSYLVAFDATAAAAVTVEPALVALSQVPCNLSAVTRCPFPTPVTAGSTVALDLTAGSALRELGIADLTGAQVGLAQVDASGAPTGAAVLLTPQVTGSTASITVPAGTAAGSYGLVIAQPTPSGGISVVAVELVVLAAETPAVVPPAAAPTTPAAAPVNAGLDSNTGVEVVETGSTGTVVVATGAGMLLLAGVGGVAVARTRRTPAVEGGTCEA